jgi:glutathione synthase
MGIEIGFVMDSIESIKIHKDSTFAMALAAQSRGWSLNYMEIGDLFLVDGRPWAHIREMQVRDDPADWYQLGPARTRLLNELNVVMMRKDPPFDMEYVYATYLWNVPNRKALWWSTGHSHCAMRTRSCLRRGSPSFAQPPW